METDFKVLGTYAGSNLKISHEHTTCGHIWNARPADILKGQNCPKCSKNNYSAISIKWLKSFNNSNIKHAENGGEAFILGFKVDGFDEKTNTVYEFHGDVYHGNLNLFHCEDRCHPFNKEATAESLWEATYAKMNLIALKYNVIFIWEDDYRNGRGFEEICREIYPGPSKISLS